MQPSDNPYLAPGAALTPGASAERSYGLASPKQRFVNYVVDHIVCVVLMTIMGAVWGFVAPESAVSAFEGISGYGISLGTSFLYYSIMEGFTGRTFGKLLTKTKVIAEDGGKPGLRALGRSLARYIPFEAFTFVSGDKPGLHDSLAKTAVVRLQPSKMQRLMEQA